MKEKSQMVFMSHELSKAYRTGTPLIGSTIRNDGRRGGKSGLTDSCDQESNRRVSEGDRRNHSETLEAVGAQGDVGDQVKRRREGRELGEMGV